MFSWCTSVRGCFVRFCCCGLTFVLGFGGLFLFALIVAIGCYFFFFPLCIVFGGSLERCLLAPRWVAFAFIKNNRIEKNDIL